MPLGRGAGPAGLVITLLLRLAVAAFAESVCAGCCAYGC